MSLLSLQAISKSYGAVAALRDITLAVPAGSRTAIVGPSASGKTTLLRIVAGFEMPDTGTVRLDGKVLADGRQAVPAHRRGVGYVAQDGALFPHLSVGDNIGFGLDASGAERDRRIGELLAMVELDASLRQRRPDQLSGGQQQRVAIARALARRPRLMLLDEPFSALDTGLRSATRKAVSDVLAKAGITTILVTHDQPEALSFADRVAVLREGRLAQFATSREIYERPASPAVATYLGEAIMLPATVADGWAICDLGRIPANSGNWRGTAQIMLRPEQVRLTDAPSSPSPAAEPDSACVGEIIEVDFAGAVSSVTIRLRPPPRSDAQSGHAPPQPLIVVRQSGVALPPVGALVHLVVDGTAHVFTSDGTAHAAPPRV